jgi:hypothetical protein
MRIDARERVFAATRNGDGAGLSIRGMGSTQPRAWQGFMKAATLPIGRTAFRW